MELHEQLDQVKDANTFLAFAHAALQPRAEQRFHLSLRK